MAADLWTAPTTIYCLRDDVHRRAGSLVFKGTDSYPTADETEAHAKGAAGQVWAAAVRYGGSAYTPAESSNNAGGTADPIDSLLIEANAVRAAMLCVEGLLLNADKRIRDLYDALREDWLRYIGDKHTGGSMRGDIGDAIASVSTTGSSSSDVTTGESTLVAAPSRDVVPPVTMDPADDARVKWD